MVESTTDTKQKKELESRQQQDNSTPVTATTTTANDYYGSRNNQVEAIAVQGPVGPDGHSVAQQAPGLVVVHEHVVVNQLARHYSSSSYRHCCYTISIEDPVEVVHARNIAIAHVVFEFLAVFTCLTNGFCVGISVLAMASSSLVACCFKQRAAYSCWSFVGLFLALIHALMGMTGYYDGAREIIAGVMQCFLLIVSVVVVIVGCRAASATGGRALLERRQAAMPMQGLSQMGQRVPLSQVDSHA